METINSVVNSASKAIWGEQNTATTETGGKEPASGLQGKGTATEPYDGGNAPTPMEPAGTIDPFTTATTASTTTPSTDITSSTTNTADTTVNDTPSTAAHTTTEPIAGSSTGTTVDETSKPTMDPTDVTKDVESKPLETTESTGVTGSSAEKVAPKSSEDKPAGSTQPTELPPAISAVLSKKDQDAKDATETLKEDGKDSLLKKHDHSGEALPIRDGPEKEKAIPATQEPKVEMPEARQLSEETQGVGRPLEKKTGVATEGSDIDATKPGASKESERLAEEKVDHKDAKVSTDKKTEAAAPAPSTTSSEGKEKVSKMDKLKEKLHIGHGHKDK